MIDNKDVLMLYFKDIEKFPLLSHEDEVKLAQKFRKSHDSRVKMKMVQANLRLVVNIAKRFSYTGVPMLDLIEEGNIGLMKAVEKFDHRKGYRFSTYAAWWIKQYIMRAIANQGKTIRVPVYMVEAIIKYKKTTDELRNRLRRTPSTSEVAKRMGVSVRKISEISQAAETQPTSLEAPIGEEEAGKFFELIEDESAISPDERIADTLRSEHIKGLLDQLPDRDKRVLISRFGLDEKHALTLQDVAKKLRITKERVRQIEERAIKKLKDLIIEQGIKEGIRDEEVLE